MDLTLVGLLWLGLSIGALHALDADHVMAMSTLVADRLKIKKVVFYCLKWGVGHGGILLILGSLLMSFELQLDEYWTGLAEQAVGIVLIILGGALIWKLKSEKIKLVFHKHGSKSHMHFVYRSELTTENETTPSLVHEHKPLIIGLLHGLAGSAPVMALLPAMMTQTSHHGLSYLIAFSLGCLFSMAVFGFVFGLFQQKLIKFNTKLFDLFRFITGLTSISLGVYWVA
ncbi:sulfite exporter TauE/SafE family protein [Catenovulum maritimum]|uniref:Urease accessory protein UreH-like transmembrane domain-containing protein n=1 Tax=Catenovulum maritimum TaxID=1513271 RepID=A0A0J8GSQ9_9ALTE|nr:sulfite exporter TauE/SafE family protein [Catenovulum maritimum]KMT63738.1 hypothetical protein XM47_18120 [Catenovulum maritimum]